MGQTLEHNKALTQVTPVELPPCEADVEVIQKLDDEPNDVGGLSAQELKERFDHVGAELKEYINETLLPAVVADDLTEQTRQAAEAERVANEIERVAQETARAEGESLREEQETGRQEAEATRETAEAARQAAEQSRVTAEEARTQEELERKEAETTRKGEETARKAAEAERGEAEQGRETAEQSRAAEEIARDQAEQERGEAEQGRETAEQTRAAAETARTQAEQSRVTAEQSRAAAETARDQAEQERAAAEQLRVSETEGVVARAGAKADIAEQAAAQAADRAAQVQTLTQETVAAALAAQESKDAAAWSAQSAGASKEEAKQWAERAEEVAGGNFATEEGVAEAVSDHDGDAEAHQALLAAKQDKIEVTGLLKGDGEGGVVAAVPGVDYNVQGAPGVTPNVQVGTVTTLPAGSDAVVTRREGSPDAAPILDFGIPEGADGDPGDPGADGKSTYQLAVDAGYTGTEEDLSAALAALGGTLPVSRGGTGAISFTAGHILIGNGTGGISTLSPGSLTAKIGVAYGVCSTAAATTAKTVSISNFALVTGARVAVTFNCAVPSNATLNVNGTGAKNIRWLGSNVFGGIIKAKDTVEMVYTGSYWYILAIDRVAFSSLDFSTASWATINAIAQAGMAKNFWQIGDQKPVMLDTGETIVVRIEDFDHDDLTAGGKAKMTLGMVGCLKDKRQMNFNNSNGGGWGNSGMKTFMTTLLNWMPSDLKNVIKQVNKKTQAGDKSSTISTTADKLWLFSYTEVGCATNTSYSPGGEGTAYPLFVSDASRIKKVNGSAAIWWLRSPCLGSYTNFCLVNSDGTLGNIVANSSYGVAVGFCI